MTTGADATHDWYGPEFFADPYPHFAALRASEPVCWSAAQGGWVITGYEPIVEILRRPEDFSSAGRMSALLDGLPEGERARFQPILDHFAVGMIRSDPPDHTRVRRLISRAFTPRVIEGRRDDIAALVDGLLEEWSGRERVDLVGDFAHPLPATVICRMLGVPTEDLDRVRRWSQGIDTIVAGACPLREAAQRTQASLLELQAYYRVMIADRRRVPRDDLMSLLVAAESEGDRLSEAELLSTAENLLSAGHETTTSLIANGMLAFHRHPEQMKLLRESPDLLPSAIEEMLRYESPVQRQTRVVKRDVELADRRMRAGQLVFMMLGAANRDPAIFAEPDRFDIRRSENPHIAFGTGVHFCIGAPLARLEAGIALAALLERFPDLRVESDAVRWMPSAALRCPQALPVRIGPAM